MCSKQRQETGQQHSRTPMTIYDASTPRCAKRCVQPAVTRKTGERVHKVGRHGKYKQGSQLIRKYAEIHDIAPSHGRYLVHLRLEVVFPLGIECALAVAIRQCDSSLDALLIRRGSQEIMKVERSERNTPYLFYYRKMPEKKRRTFLGDRPSSCVTPVCGVSIAECAGWRQNRWDERTYV